MQKIIYTFLFLLVFFHLSAQEDKEDRYEWLEDESFLLNANFSLGFPVSDFKENVESIGVGGSGSLLFLVRKSIPIYVGIEAGGMQYDRQNGLAVYFLDGFWTNIELETRTSIFFGHAIFRLDPKPNFWVQPYFDGMVGFKNLFTRTLLYDLDVGDDEPFDRFIESGDWAFSYGGALGFQIPISTQTNVGIKIDVKCAYLKGSAADYFVRREDSPNLVIDEPIDAFEERNSITDMVIPQIGVVFTFGPKTNFDDEEEEYDEYEDEY